MIYHTTSKQKTSTLFSIILGCIFVFIGGVIWATEFMNCSGWKTVNVTYTVANCQQHKNSRTKRHDTNCSYVAEYSYNNRKYYKTLDTHDRRPSIFYIDPTNPNKSLPYPPEGDYTMAIIILIAGAVSISIGIIQRVLKIEEREWEQEVQNYVQNHANESHDNTVKESQEYNISDLREYDNQKLKS